MPGARASGQGGVEALEADQRFQPRPRRCQRDFDLQHQAVGAPQVVHAQRLGAAQLDDLWLGLDRHRADAQHVAGRAERPVVDRADPAEAAAEQPAERGAAEGRRDAAEFVARGPRRLLDVDQPDAGLRAGRAGAHPAHRVVARHVEHHAASERRGLAVVAGAAAADRDRQLAARAGADQAAYLVFGPRPYHGVGALVFQLALEHGAEPGEVLRQAGDAARVVDPVEVGEFELQLLDGGDGSVHGKGRVNLEKFRWRARSPAPASTATPSARTGPRR